MRRFIYAVLTLTLAASSALCLQSCSGIDNAYSSIMTLLGFDMNDYESETILSSVSEEDEVYSQIETIISMLIYDSVYIEPFENPRAAASGNGDAILNYMLLTSYASYSGNSELLAAAEEEYSQYSITILIPASDFESRVYSSFGGDSSVKHTGTVHFIYLSKVEAYTTTGQAVSPPVTITVTSAVETQNTYRVEFTLTEADAADDGGDLAASYKSLYMKREDGTIYMKYLRDIED